MAPKENGRKRKDFYSSSKLNSFIIAWKYFDTVTNYIPVASL